MNKIIFTNDAPKPIGPYSQAYISDNLIFCSGQISIDPYSNDFIDGTIEQQTEQIIRNIKALLRSAGTSIENVVKTTCYLTDMDHFNSFNNIYTLHFTSFPARSCLAVKQLPKNALVEIEVIASVE